MEEEKLEKIKQIDLSDEMRKSYIDYAMSVIVSRALPDVRDGLKPVHRRILYAMHELNLDPSKGYKKSARIVGDTMGKYHPHGDASIYDSMVRMAQDFSMRYMLVDGHGNFGSMDGDGAAAPRYTEARLSHISLQMLADIDKNTVDFVPNYDQEFMEPSVLPSRFPNLLVNGSSGIAVGMATYIPPHNLVEVVDGILKVIDDRVNNVDTNIKDLLAIIKGPDFPTHGLILGTNGIKEAYLTGRGKILVRAKAAIEVNANRESIIITELPYQVNKARLVEKIGSLVGEKKIEGIYDIRDESDRNGVRVVIDLKKDANSNVILNQLYKYSQMQESFGLNMLALVNNKPKTLTLKELLYHYLEHQKEVITRRTQFDLDKAEKRAHILEGYLLVLENMDEVLSLIRGSKDSAAARSELSTRFMLTERQTEAIIDMRFRSLTSLEREKLQKEYDDIKITITELTAILQDEKRLYQVIRDEITIIKNKYGDKRRTEIIQDSGEIDYEDLIDEETSVITMSFMDYIKRQPLSTYKSQNRGGRGILGMGTRDEDVAKNLFVASTHDNILFFTSLGKAYSIKSYEIPESGRAAKGIAIVNLLNLSPGEKIAAVIPVRTFSDDEYLVMVTKLGSIKKTALSHFNKIRNSGILALNFREDDELIAVLKTQGDCEIFVATKEGMGLRFSESEVRVMGRTAAGVRAITLNSGDYVVSADTLDNECQVLFVTSGGFGKRTETEEFSSRHRGGKGVKIYRITEKTGYVVGVAKVNDRDELMLINSDGVILRIRIADISTQKRVTLGVKLINLPENGEVISIAKIGMELCDDDKQDDEQSDEFEQNEIEQETIEQEEIVHDDIEQEEIPQEELEQDQTEE